MKDEKSILEQTNKAIKEVIDIFQAKHFFFLNEEDVKSYLYYKLVEKFKDRDNDTTMVHCNLTDETNIRADIFIGDNTDFNEDPDYYFKSSFTSIEIKYCIKVHKSGVLRRLKEDYDKLFEIEENSIVLIFDHNAHLEVNDIIKIQEEKSDKDSNIRIVYVTPEKVICVQNSKACELVDESFNINE